MIADKGDCGVSTLCTPPFRENEQSQHFELGASQSIPSLQDICCNFFLNNKRFKTLNGCCELYFIVQRRIDISKSISLAIYFHR